MSAVGDMAYAIKAEVRDDEAATFAFVAQKTMYGGKRVARGDEMFVFASENEGGRGLIARAVVVSAEPVAKLTVHQLLTHSSGLGDYMQVPGFWDEAPTWTSVEALTAGVGSIAKLRKVNVAKLPLVKGTPRLGPCVGGTRNFIAIGLNYSDHAAETGATVPPEPIIFTATPARMMSVFRLKEKKPISSDTSTPIISASSTPAAHEPVQ